MGFYSHIKSSFFAVMMTTKRSQTIRLTLQNLNIFFFFSSNGKRGTRTNVDRSRRIYSPLQLPLCDLPIKWLLWDSNSTFTAWETVILTFRLGDLAQTHLSESTFFHAPICMFVLLSITIMSSIGTLNIAFFLKSMILIPVPTVSIVGNVNIFIPSIQTC